MKTMLILNSDFGSLNTVGARALPIAQQIKNKDNLVIFCRDYNKEYKNKFYLKKVVPAGKFIMQSLTGISIYITSKLPINKSRVMIFDYFLLQKLKKINLYEFTTIHSWDYLPKSFEYIKKSNKDIKLIADNPMSHTSILKKLKDKNELWIKNALKQTSDFNNSQKYVDLFIVPSEVTKESLILENISENKIIIIPFGVDSNKFKPKKKSNKIIKFAFSGNVNQRKGIPYLIEAFNELNLENSELNIYGRVYPEINKWLNESSNKKIIFHGFKDLTKELPNNHVFVFPSLLEGSAKSIYEAMASGLPIITTHNSGSIIEDNKEGFIIPVQDKIKLKEKMLYFYNNIDSINIMGNRARKKALEYTWERYAKDVIKYYTK